ncbi:MAG TPA: SDR family oxidoreductase [Steroidobacteraceae bacterium]|nr:SDR family oxidoreductase [Steroidobacteraceae bacterium]
MKWFKRILAGLAVLLVGMVIWLGASTSGAFHTPTSLHELAPFQATPGSVLVVGGTQNLGLQIVRELQQRGQSVTAAVRATSNTSALDALGVEEVVFDAMDAEAVRDAITPGRFSAVVSTMGTSARDLPARRSLWRVLLEGRAKVDPAIRPDYVGNRNIMDAAKAAGVRRFVFVTVIGAGDSRDAAPSMARRALGDIIPLKEKAEDHLRASGLAYTIIRPGGLGRNDLAATGTARLTEDADSFSYIARADLAPLVVDALGDPSTIARTFTAYDRSRLNFWNILSD